jgi:hypothetical protein
MGSLWLGVRESRRRADRAGSGRIAIALWISVVPLALNVLSIALLNLRQSSTSAEYFIVVVGFGATIAHLGALTALTAMSVAGARSKESPNRAWWLAAGSGLIVLVGNWTTPIVASLLQDRSEANLVVVLNQGVDVASIMLLLAALALGLPTDDREEAHQPS